MACVMRLPELFVVLEPLPPTPFVWTAIAHMPEQNDEPEGRL